MFRQREFPCYDAVEAAVDCLCREAVIMQNIAEYGGFDERIRHLRGLSAAAHRNWRTLNERLFRMLVVSVNREDVSSLVREMAELADRMVCTAAMWQHTPFAGAQKWTARLAEGCGLLRDIIKQLPPQGDAQSLADCAEQLHDLRRESNSHWGRDLARLHGAAKDVSAGFHECCVRMARIADTAEWLTLKNT